MSENISLPTSFDLSGSNVAEKWKPFKQRFDIYLLASNQQQCEEKRNTALILHCLGSEILPIYNSFEFKKLTTQLIMKQLLLNLMNILFKKRT